MRQIFFIFLTSLLLWASSAHANSGTSFVDFEGQPRAVSDYFSQDKWTVVMIWAHDCHVCNEEAAGYAFFHDGNERAQVLGLSMDGILNKKAAETFIDNHDLPFTNLIGEPGAVAAYYQNQTGQRFIGTPAFLVFDPSGELLAAQIGGVPPDVISRFIDSRSNNAESKN